MSITEKEIRELMHDRSSGSPPNHRRVAEVTAGIRRWRRLRNTSIGTIAALATATIAVTSINGLQFWEDETTPVASAQRPAASVPAPTLPKTYKDKEEGTVADRVATGSAKYPEDATITLSFKGQGRPLGLAVLCAGPGAEMPPAPDIPSDQQGAPSKDFQEHARNATMMEVRINGKSAGGMNCPTMRQLVGDPPAGQQFMLTVEDDAKEYPKGDVTIEVAIGKWGGKGLPIAWTAAVYEVLP